MRVRCAGRGDVKTPAAAASRGETFALSIRRMKKLLNGRHRDHRCGLLAVSMTDNYPGAPPPPSRLHLRCTSNTKSDKRRAMGLRYYLGHSLLSTGLCLFVSSCTAANAGGSGWWAPGNMSSCAEVLMQEHWGKAHGAIEVRNLEGTKYGSVRGFGVSTYTPGWLHMSAPVQQRVCTVSSHVPE